MIIPAILEKDFEEIKRKIALFENEARFFHIDVADGSFVPNTTFLEGERMKEIFKISSAKDVARLVRHAVAGRDESRWKNIGFEAHLMTLRPHNHYKRWIEGGASVVIFHIESFFNIKWKLREFAVNNLSNLIKKAGAEPVIALNPETKIDLIEPYLMKNIFRVHFLSVNPGFQGNHFIPEVIDKVRNLKNQFPDVKISIDGGINEKTILEVKKAGAEIFGIGSGVYGARDPVKVYKNLQNILHLNFKSPAFE